MSIDILFHEFLHHGSSVLKFSATFIGFPFTTFLIVIAMAVTYEALLLLVWLFVAWTARILHLNGVAVPVVCLLELDEAEKPRIGIYAFDY